MAAVRYDRLELDEQTDQGEVSEAGEADFGSKGDTSIRLP